MPPESAVECILRVTVALEAAIRAFKECRDALPYENDDALDILGELLDEHHENTFDLIEE